MIPVAVAPNKFARGLDGTDRAVPDAYEVVDVREALVRTYATDAHLVAYVLPGRAKQPRINKTALASAPVMPTVQVCLCDVDNPGHAPWTPDLFDAAQKQDADTELLQTAGVYYTAHGRRIVQPIAEPIGVDRVEPYLRRWLLSLEAAGLCVDWACRDWTRHFRLPNVRRAGREYRSPRIDLARMVPVTLEALPPAQVHDAPTALSTRRRTRPPVREWTEDLPPTWQAKVAPLAKAVCGVEAEWHELFLALAGALLARDVPPEHVPALCRAVSVATGADTRTSDRESAARTTVARWVAGHPVQGYRKLRADYPLVADALDEVLARGAEARARMATCGISIPETRPLAETVAALENEIRNAPRGVTVIAAECGIGKTRAALRVAAERAEAGLRTAISVDKNSLAIQVTNDLRAMGATVRRVFGPLSVFGADGKPVCVMAELAKPLVEGGYSLQRTLCRRPDGSRCNHYSSCPARSGRDGPKDAAIVVSTHALVGNLIEWVGDGGLLVVDEPPSLVESERVSLADLRRAKAALSLFEAEYAKEMTPALESAISVAEDGGPPTDLLRHRCLGAFPRASKGPPVRAECLVTAAASLSWARELGRVAGTLRALEHICAGEVNHASVRVVGGRRCRSLRLAYPRASLCDAFSNANMSVVLMDAGADVHVPVLERLMGEEPRLRRFLARDGSLIHRALLRTTGATRRHWFEMRHETPSARSLAALEKALAWAAESRATTRLGIITFRPLANELHCALQCDAMRRTDDESADTQPPMHSLAGILRQWPGTIEVAHYGAVRGLDSMKDVDALITLGDPWPNLGEVQHEVESLCLPVSWERRVEELCQAELEQAHGRVRAAHRTRPARVAHVGSVLPGGSGWLHDVDFRHDVGGRPTIPSTCAQDELQAAVRIGGGLRATARRIGCSHVALHRYLRGRPVPAAVGSQVRSLVERTSPPVSVVPIAPL